MTPPRDVAELTEMIACRQILATAKIQRVLEHVLENPADVAFANTRSLARCCDVSITTVGRAARAAGFEEFKEFRELFRRELKQRQKTYILDHMK